MGVDLSVEEIGDVDQFVTVFNRLANLTTDEVSDMFGKAMSNENRNNKIKLMQSYLAKIVKYNKEVTDYWQQVLLCQQYPKKTENMEFYTLLYGEEHAKEKLNKKASRVKGENNPGYQHGGKFSPFSKKFVAGDISEETKKKAVASRDANNSVTARLSYWTERYGEEEGQRLYYDRQNTFNREKLIAKYGEEEGIRRWNERQEKWLASLEALPEEKKIEINAKKGFWKHSEPKTQLMDPDDPFNQIDTKLYVIEYQPLGYDKSFIKIGVTSKYLSQRFPSVTIKDVIKVYHADRFTNFNRECEIKKYILGNQLSILIESEDKKFDGWTECVEIEHKDELLEVVNEAVRKYNT